MRAIFCRPRAAITVVELLVVIGIISVALGLLLPAILQVRAAALQTHSSNNLRQIGVAVQSFAGDLGRLPAIDGTGPREDGWYSMFTQLLPYIEHGKYYAEIRDGTRPLNSNYTVKPYVNPADPTLADVGNAPGATSYAANALLFIKKPDLTRTVRDGTSNTIAFAEHYARCGDFGNFDSSWTEFNWFSAHTSVLALPGGNSSVTVHRATFADVHGDQTPQPPADVHPVTAGSPPMSVGSVSGLTFQIRPLPRDADPRLAQTPHSAMLVGLADGSVRTLAKGMSEFTYWAAVTPAGSEALGNDW